MLYISKHPQKIKIVPILDDIYIYMQNNFRVIESEAKPDNS